MKLVDNMNKEQGKMINYFRDYIVENLGEKVVKTLEFTSIISEVSNYICIGLKIIDINLNKQTKSFIEGMNSGKISPKKLEKYKIKLNRKNNWFYDELSRVLVYLNQIQDERKSVLLGKIYKQYVYQIISWDEFIELVETVNKIFWVDFLKLLDVYNKILVPEFPVSYHFERLKTLGLVTVNIFEWEYLNGQGNEINKNKIIELTDFGNKLCNINFDIELLK